MHDRGFALLVRSRTAPAVRVGADPLSSLAKNASLMLLAGGSLAAGMLAGHHLDGHRLWAPVIAGAIIGGFGMGTVGMLLPDTMPTEKRALGLATYTLGGLGTGIAIMGLVDGKRA